MSDPAFSPGEATAGLSSCPPLVRLPSPAPPDYITRARSFPRCLNASLTLWPAGGVLPLEVFRSFLGGEVGFRPSGTGYGPANSYHAQKWRDARTLNSALTIFRTFQGERL